MKPVTALLAALLLFGGCGGEGTVPGSGRGIPLDNVPAAAWEKLAGKRIREGFVAGRTPLGVTKRGSFLEVGGVTCILGWK
jgi:hypothetical protein